MIIIHLHLPFNGRKTYVLWWCVLKGESHLISIHLKYLGIWYRSLSPWGSDPRYLFLTIQSFQIEMKLLQLIQFKSTTRLKCNPSFKTRTFLLIRHTWPGKKWEMHIQNFFYYSSAATRVNFWPSCLLKYLLLFFLDVLHCVNFRFLFFFTVCGFFP